MFICEPCLSANDIAFSHHSRSIGPCEICDFLESCLDIPLWQLPDRPLAPRREDHEPAADA